MREGTVAVRAVARLIEVGAAAGILIGMGGVCLLAALVPTMHALRIEPTEALRAEV